MELGIMRRPRNNKKSCDEPYCVECLACVCIRYACYAHVYVMMAAFCCYKFLSHSSNLYQQIQCVYN